MFKIGDKILIKSSNEEYVVCRIKHKTYTLISLTTFNRWSDFVIPLNEDEKNIEPRHLGLNSNWADYFKFDGEFKKEIKGEFKDNLDLFKAE